MRRAIRRLSLLSVLLTAVCAFGQTGHWVSHPNDVSGLGAHIGDCGGTTAVYGRDETDHYLLRLETERRVVTQRAMLVR